MPEMTVYVSDTGDRFVLVDWPNALPYRIADLDDTYLRTTVGEQGPDSLGDL